MEWLKSIMPILILAVFIIVSLLVLSALAIIITDYFNKKRRFKRNHEHMKEWWEFNAK